MKKRTAHAQKVAIADITAIRYNGDWPLETTFRVLKERVCATGFEANFSALLF